MATKIMALGYEIETETRGTCETLFVYMPRQPGEGREYMGRVVTHGGEVSHGDGFGRDGYAQLVRIVVRAGLATLPT